jgi:SAM-dependent methyltransferase
MIPASQHWHTPDWHFEKIGKEMEVEDKARMLGVVGRMAAQEVPDLTSIDWANELATFPEVEYPTYYQQPFHSVPGGYLTEQAASADRRAMEAIYQDFHPRRSLGIRDELAKLIPADAKKIADLGSGTGDAAAAIARRLPDAEVLGLDASPFMTIAARHQNGDVVNVRYERGFAEATGLDDDSLDAIAITLVFHECPDKIKQEILLEAYRILKPGGTLVLTDTPTDDLHTYRGFYEPYKEQWKAFAPETFLAAAGFEGAEDRSIAPPLWSQVAQKPA